MILPKLSTPLCWSLILLAAAVPRMAKAEVNAQPHWVNTSRKLWPRDRKREDTPPRMSGRSAGSRGCAVGASDEASVMPALMLLAPVNEIAQTGLTQPSFAWYLDAQATQPLFFRLYETTDSESGGLNLLYEFSPSGFVRLELPETYQVSPPQLNEANQLGQYPAGISMLDLAAFPQAPQLKSGHRYIWQIELVCDPRRPSGNLFAQAELQVLADVEGQVVGKMTPWQDALKASLASASPAEQGLKELLKAVALNEVELAELASSPLHRLAN